MRIIFFDLGQTLEENDVLLPGAIEMLSAVHEMRDSNNEPLRLGLISDFTAAATPQEAASLRQEYAQIITALGITPFFEPLAESVTLSTEVGVTKLNPKIFRTAIDKIEPDLPFDHVIFITENQTHVAAARKLGMHAIHFQGPGQTTGEAKTLADLVPLLGIWACLGTSGG